MSKRSFLLFESKPIGQEDFIYDAAHLELYFNINHNVISTSSQNIVHNIIGAYCFVLHHLTLSMVEISRIRADI